MELQGIEKYGSVKVEVTRFMPSSECGVVECLAMFHEEDVMASFSQQVISLLDAWHSFQKKENSNPVFVRFFLSDVANQLPELKKMAGYILESACCSVVQQPPLDGTKVAVWVYLQTGVESKRLDDFSFQCSHGAYLHYWTGNLTIKEGDSASQTETLLNYYSSFLKDQHISLSNNCVRTWFFVQNVDVNYKGVVVARKQLFERHRLVPETHYITSTGIEGRSEDASSLVRMDAYSISGLKSGQQQYLYAKSYLNPTYEYGVTFERGVKVYYGDRAHIFISGTASIDNKGNVLYEGDVVKQTERMWKNTLALLHEGGASFEDVAYMFVYLRDVSDFAVVRKMYDDRFPNVPKVILYAPVCRPGWLIEMECMAIISEAGNSFPDF